MIVDRFISGFALLLDEIQMSVGMEDVELETRWRFVCCAYNLFLANFGR